MKTLFKTLSISLFLALIACSRDDNHTPELTYRTDVYVAGYEGILGKSEAALWKNGEPTTLVNSPYITSAHSVFIKGNDVYVAFSEATQEH